MVEEPVAGPTKTASRDLDSRRNASQPYEILTLARAESKARSVPHVRTVSDINQRRRRRRRCREVLDSL